MPNATLYGLIYNMFFLYPLQLFFGQPFFLCKYQFHIPRFGKREERGRYIIACWRESYFCFRRVELGACVLALLRFGQDVNLVSARRQITTCIGNIVCRRLLHNPLGIFPTRKQTECTAGKAVGVVVDVVT